MKNYLKLIRVKQWIKNILVLVPVICAKKLGMDNITLCLLALFGFSFTTSFIYILNDLKDIEKDKLHPRKSKRPLPSGKISVKNAIITSIIMLVLSFILTMYACESITKPAFIILISYIVLNILYSLGLKNVAIVDVAILSAGFVLRVYYGAFIFDINVSNWLFLTIMCGSLFLGLGKRKKEIISCKESRKVLDDYNEAFLDKFQYLSLALMMVFYSLWTMEQANQLVIYSIPLILLIFMKYSLVIEKTNEGDPTTVLYEDKMLLCMCILYALLMLMFFLVI